MQGSSLTLRLELSLVQWCWDPREPESKSLVGTTHGSQLIRYSNSCSHPPLESVGESLVFIENKLSEV